MRLECRLYHVNVQSLVGTDNLVQFAEYIRTLGAESGYAEMPRKESSEEL
jgi:hypothetical protein